MNLKWIGAVLVIVGCGGVGFSMAAFYRKEEKALRNLTRILEYMECELGYRMIPLPLLFHQVAECSGGTLKRIFRSVSEEMDAQISPDARCCMKIVLEKSNDLPNRLYQALMMLGASLGQFDLDGQLKQIAAVKKHCESELAVICDQRENRIRSYQTLGLCAGAALAILFI